MRKSILDTKKVGEKLNKRESKQLFKIVNELLETVGQRRKHFLLTHNSLQNTIGIFLQLIGWYVQYELPFMSGGFEAEKVIFDIVADKGRRTVVVEVKDFIKSRDLGQVWGYVDTVQLRKVKTDVYLGTDILNYNSLIYGTTGQMISGLMEDGDIGIILADKYFMITCDNYAQLVLEEMPEFVFSEEKVD